MAVSLFAKVAEAVLGRPKVNVEPGEIVLSPVDGGVWWQARATVPGGQQWGMQAAHTPEAALAALLKRYPVLRGPAGHG